MTNARESLKKTLSQKTFSKEEIVSLLSLQDPSLLFDKADKVRQKFVGNGVYLRALIEFSNHCKNDCLYCGIRRSNLQSTRYRLTPTDIVNTAQKASSFGYRTVVLQSGEDAWFDADKLCEIIREIKKMDLAVTLSIGEKTYEEYAAYRKAGADRYLLRIETSDKALYEKLDPNMSWDNRINCLYTLKELGYEVGSGSLVGLPEQTPESLAEDLLFFQNLPVDMAGIGPFIPHPHTPLATEKNQGNFELSLKMMALMRLMLPDINIPATTAMETLHPRGRALALECGANVIMPNLTETCYRAQYDLYPGKTATQLSPSDTTRSAEELIRSLGREVSYAYGFHGDYLNKKN
jgi:biotin synthase